MNELRKATQWWGRYRDVGFEIRNYSLQGDDCWAFYIYLPLDRVPSGIAESLWLGPDDSYMSHPIIGEIDFHGGVTWYSKELIGREAKRAIKIGCDYQHCYDAGKTYDVGFVEQEGRRAIDSLYELIPELGAQT